MTSQEKERLDRYMDYMVERVATRIGYPFSTDFDYSELNPLLRHHLNNVGDPFVESTLDVTSHGMEREVIAFFADLFRAPEHNSWGYVTNGGSEGNLYGLYIARELYPQAMVYYSSATHYSVQKSIHLLNMPSIVIRTAANGEMNYDDLQSSIKHHRHQPAIVIANIGTTMTEAKDNVSSIRKILQDAAMNSYYIHCDAALAGPYLSLLEADPQFDFVHGADSIACSGHKFLGTPFPCGVVIVRKSYKDRIGQPLPYIGSMDTTITGSRNGHNPIFIWYAIKKQGREGLLKRILESLSLAAYTQRRLQEGGIPAWRNENAITVVFPKPDQHICQKWQLACDAGQSHIICMPGISKETLDKFIDELLCNSDKPISHNGLRHDLKTYQKA
jgi:histidine decarboxylase